MLRLPLFCAGGGCRPRPTAPRVLTVAAHDEARRFNQKGGWTGLDQATIEAVRGGAQPGDPLPPRQPGYYLDLVTDPEVIITGSGEDQRVVVLFSHRHFPGVRFGHRFLPDLFDRRRAALALMEDIKTSGRHPRMEFAPFDGRGDAFALIEETETGALHHMMDAQPAPDDHGIIWTTRGDPGPDPESGPAPATAQDPPA